MEQEQVGGGARAGHRGRMRRAVATFGAIALAVAVGRIVGLAAVRTLDFEYAPDGTRILPGTVLTDQFEPIGVVFPGGVEVVQCRPDLATCRRARSGDRVVRSRLRDEFTREPFQVTFGALQREVTLYVRLDAPDGAGTRGEAQLCAYDDAGRPAGCSGLTRFLNDGTWHRLHAGNPFGSARIHRVTLTGGFLDAPGAPANNLLVDDLVYDSSAPTGTAPDVNPPRVTIVEPFEGQSFTPVSSSSGTPVELSVRVTEDRQLADVRYQTVHDATGLVLTDFDAGIMCGPVISPCGDPHRFTGSAFPLLSAGLPGAYTLTVRACDAAGRCGADARHVMLESSPPAVRALKLEVNQGVADEPLYVPPGPGGDVVVGTPTLPLVPGRNTVIRYYLVADGGPRSGFAATLRVQIFNRDGSTITRSLLPNTDVLLVDVPADPGPGGRDDLLHAMRPDKQQTLNFVVPGILLESADTIGLTLGRVGEAVTGQLQLRFYAPVALGLYPIRILRTGFSTSLDRIRAVMDHLRATAPISELRSPNMFAERWEAVLPGTSGGFGFRFASYTGARDCDSILSWVRTTFSDDTLPRAGAPDYKVTLGILPDGIVSDCLGKAYLSGPPSSISYADTNVAPQEITHTMGITHASNAHDEVDGGGFETWPYPHGMMSPDGVRTFGVIAQPTLEPTLYDAGLWTLTIVDPCPDATLADRLAGCPALDEAVMHDFMSYGRSLPWTEGVFGLNRFRWASDITYGRMYGYIRDRVLSPPSGWLDGATSSSVTDASAAGALAGDPIPPPASKRVEAFILSGVIPEQGLPELLWPLIRKPLPESMLTTVQGPYTLVLLGAPNQVLLQQSFDVEHDGHADHNAQFWVAVPYVEGVRELRIYAGSELLFEQLASPSVPQVRVTSPNGGEIISDGTLTVKWDGFDADKDPLTFLVQYSPDGGQSWEGITMTDTLPFEAQVNVGELLPGQQALIRVTASDGVNTAVDVSDQPFMVTGTSKQ